MHDELDDGGRSLSDAALVHAARRRIVRAVTALADHPLDEDAVAGMREALGEPVRLAQAALRRLRAGDGPIGRTDLGERLEASALTTDAGGALPPPGAGRARRCTTWSAGGVA
ncbi:hypothetical protein SAMN05660350_04999 [Geodermatophilus obscurus]|uniref:Uncharacterized protein n=1 Tax=Geodermatophilus obscurus TaxID=1861 RepID=A0A1M7V1D6_9ACTN|nr:hypothetical protein [Geodermatophilus obscurus]SHN89007.1 hypothetical protein SAMN05660350_04999 [Geodermatophilus obscurus]